MLTIEALNTYGANTAEGLNRCMNNESFYFRLIKMSLQDSSFDKLRTALEAGDLSAAFEAAHALKGVMGNLALTPIYKPVAEATELLRRGTQMDYAPYVEEILHQKELLSQLCAD